MDSEFRFFDDDPIANAPAYSSGINERIELYKGSATILPMDHHWVRVSGSEQYSAQGSIFLDWFPQPHIGFWFDIDSRDSVGLRRVEIATEIGTIRGSVTRGTYLKRDKKASVFSKFDRCWEISGSIESAFIGNQESVPSVLFHLPNFTSYSGEHVTNAKANAQWPGRLHICWDQWDLVIDAVEDSDDLSKGLGRSGGYCITNIGKLTKNDRSLISFSEILALVEPLRYILAFIRGAWCSPVILIGEGKEYRWEYWDTQEISPWLGRSGWFFHRVDAQNLSKMFETFFQLWDNPAWQGVIKDAIRWYVEANTNRNHHISIVNAQVGLELLAWAYLVEYGAIISEKSFRSLDASDRIRLLLHEGRIGFGFREELPNLGRIFTDKRLTGPDAIVQLRNSAVHPNIRDKIARASNDAKLEARVLSIHYLELAMLYIFGYKGVYWSRISGQQIVPWDV